MPQFKIRHADGDELVVSAARAVTDGVTTAFESPDGGDWNVVYHVATADVSSVQRRVVEASGMARWVNERPRVLSR